MQGLNFYSYHDEYCTEQINIGNGFKTQRQWPIIDNDIIILRYYTSCSQPIYPTQNGPNYAYIFICISLNENIPISIKTGVYS